MPPQPETSSRSRDLLRRGLAADRSDEPSHRRHRRNAASTSYQGSQGPQGSDRSRLSATVGRTAKLLEARPAERLPLPRQDPQHTPVIGHGAKGHETRGCQSEHQKAGNTPHATTFLGDQHARSRRGPVNHQQDSGPFQLHHHHDLLAHPPTALRPHPQPHRLATRETMSQVGRRSACSTAAPEQASTSSTNQLRVIDLLRKYTPGLLSRRRVSRQVKSTLAKIHLCQTAPLKGHIYECPNCGSRKNVYNSCVDRHCPQCGGAKRADWLSKTSELIVPGINYFQVVFTLPDKLSGLILGNRKPTTICCFIRPGDHFDIKSKSPVASAATSTSRRHIWCYTPETNSWTTIRISTPSLPAADHRSMASDGSRAVTRHNRVAASPT